VTLHWLDHALFVLVVVIFPLTDLRSLGRKRDAIRAGRTELRPALFRSIIWQEWATLASLLAIWFGLGRTAGGLGTLPTAAAWSLIGIAVTLVGCVLLILQVRWIADSPDRQIETRKKLEPVAYLIARTPTERRLWVVASVTAGICEEVIYRGFIIAYLSALTGWPLWATIGISGAIFGFVHLYQGAQGVVRTGIVGLVLGAVYGLTGSLISPIVLHMVIDLTSGRIGEIVIELPEAA
jgi:membrane protease YdiL (CAAX protease family)